MEVFSTLNFTSYIFSEEFKMFRKSFKTLKVAKVITFRRNTLKNGVQINYRQFLYEQS